MDNKSFDFSLVYQRIPGLLEYLPNTLFITVIAMFFGVLLGLMIAVIKINRIPVLSQGAAVFVSFMRGTPLLIQLYLGYYGIPLLVNYINQHYGINIINANLVNPLVCVLVIFSFNEAAYNSESIRAALQSVPKGAIEAAQSLGMTPLQVLRRIILPEALVVALPTLGNTFISLLKATSLAFVCSVTEMTARGKIYGGYDFHYTEVYISLALIYWALTMIIEQIVKYLENKMSIPEPSQLSHGQKGE